MKSQQKVAKGSMDDSKREFKLNPAKELTVMTLMFARISNVALLIYF